VVARVRFGFAAGRVAHESIHVLPGIFEIVNGYQDDFICETGNQLQNRSSRREEAPYFLQFEPRYLGCYEVLKEPPGTKESV
jgi:hypothetical protein